MFLGSRGLTCVASPSKLLLNRRTSTCCCICGMPARRTMNLSSASRTSGSQTPAKLLCLPCKAIHAEYTDTRRYCLVYLDHIATLTVHCCAACSPTTWNLAACRTHIAYQLQMLTSENRAMSVCCMSLGNRDLMFLMLSCDRTPPFVCLNAACINTYDQCHLMAISSSQMQC